MNQNKKLNEFLYKYEARARLSNQYHRRHRSVKFNYADIDQAFDSLAVLPFEEEPYVEILIPQDRFHHLVEMEEYSGRREHEYNWAQEEQKRQHRERWIRQKNPAVQKAWERYQLLLGLADEGK